MTPKPLSIPFWIRQWSAVAQVAHELSGARRWEGYFSGDATEFRFCFNVHSMPGMPREVTEAVLMITDGADDEPHH